MSRVDEIRERLRKATPGPWECDAPEEDDDVFDYHGNGGSEVVTKAFGREDNRVRDYGHSRGDFICDLNDGEYHMYRSAEEQFATADLIANAPSDIDYLLSELDRVTRERDKAAKVVHDHRWGGKVWK